jgi:hypothetical protein
VGAHVGFNPGMKELNQQLTKSLIVLVGNLIQYKKPFKHKLIFGRKLSLNLGALVTDQNKFQTFSKKTAF